MKKLLFLIVLPLVLFEGAARCFELTGNSTYGVNLPEYLDQLIS
jgi:hypothetical protein